MNIDENVLIERLKVAAQGNDYKYPHAEYGWVKQRARPPITEKGLLHAEQLIGFSLPPVLKRIYLEVGNGGFGPGYGLLPLLTPRGKDANEHLSVIHTTLVHHQWGGWPRTLLVLNDWGCFIHSSMDCASPTYPIIRSEQNLHYGIEARSLHYWLNCWLEGDCPFSLDTQKLPPVNFL